MNQRIEQTYWGVLSTHLRTEMKVAERLEKRGVKAYCPVRMEMRQRSDRGKNLDAAAAFNGLGQYRRARKKQSI